MSLKSCEIRKAVIKSINFESPEFIPITFHINESCWEHYPQDFLFEMMETHPFLFPEFKKPNEIFKPVFSGVTKKDVPYMDDWGCVWETTMNGITGTVTKHPLSDWNNYDEYKIPDFEKCFGLGEVNWAQVEKYICNLKDQGKLTIGGLVHGHTFLRLCDIRGYTNLMYDMSDEEPKLMDLIDEIEKFNIGVLNKYIDMKVDMMIIPEDLGMQNAPMLSPGHFRKYIKPSYQRMMKLVKDSGIYIHFHSDGFLHELMDDILDCGVDVINLQDLVNGIDYISHKLSGRVCVELDIDRQSITPSGTPRQIDDLIRNEVKILGDKKGGLMMIYGLYPGIPRENIKALMDSLEMYMFYFR